MDFYKKDLNLTNLTIIKYDVKHSIYHSRKILEKDLDDVPHATL